MAFNNKHWFHGCGSAGGSADLGWAQTAAWTLQTLGRVHVFPVYLHLDTQADGQQLARARSSVVDSSRSGAHWEPAVPLNAPP